MEGSHPYLHDLRLAVPTPLVWLLPQYAGAINAKWYLANDEIPFLSSVRDPEKKKVIGLVHEQLKSEAQKLGVATQL